MGERIKYTELEVIITKNQLTKILYQVIYTTFVKF